MIFLNPCESWTPPPRQGILAVGRPRILKRDLPSLIFGASKSAVDSSTLISWSIAAVSSPMAAQISAIGRPPPQQKSI